MSDDGFVLSNDGLDLELSRVMRRIINPKAAKPKYVRWLRLFLRFEFRAGEGPYAFLTECQSEAVLRCVAFFESIGLVVDRGDNHLDAGYDVSHPTAIRYLRTAVSVLRQLYTRLAEGLRKDPASPMDVTGWHLLDTGEKLRWAMAHQMKIEHGLKHAGSRFHVLDIKSSVPAIEDPSSCGPEMTEALIAAEVPETILDVAMVMQDNGARNGSALEGNALGWAMESFGDQFMGKKKRGGDSLCLRITMSDTVFANVTRRMSGSPHPTRAGASLMDHLRELWAIGTDAARAELATYPLFPSSLGKAYTYSGFYYWFDDAIDGRVFIRTTNSQRKPTSQWYRHAAISDDVRELFERTTKKSEREQGLLEILDSYGLSSDQTERYAAFEYARDGRRRQREAVARRRKRNADKRASCETEVRTGRLSLEAARMAHDALPVRRKNEGT